MDTGCTVWVTDKCSQERACSLMWPSDIELLISSWFLMQSLITFLTCDSCHSCELGQGTHRKYDPFTHPWWSDSTHADKMPGIWLTGLGAVCNNRLGAWLYFPYLSPATHTSGRQCTCPQRGTAFFLGCSLDKWMGLERWQLMQTCPEICFENSGFC